MKRSLVFLTIFTLALIFTASLASARPKNRTLTGTWDCHAHGGAGGDITFTLYLKENKEIVDGSISSPVGSTDVASGTFRRDMLELTFDLPQGNYTLMAKMEKGKLSGTWSLDTDKGTWEATKHAE